MNKYELSAVKWISIIVYNDLVDGLMDVSYGFFVLLLMNLCLKTNTLILAWSLRKQKFIEFHVQFGCISWNTFSSADFFGLLQVCVILVCVGEYNGNIFHSSSFLGTGVRQVCETINISKQKLGYLGAPSFVSSWSWTM